MEPLHLALLDLHEGQCRFPFGDGPVFSFCGCPTREDRSYCDGHHDLTHTPARPHAEAYYPRGGKKAVAA